MSLFRQLIFAITFLIILLMSGNLVVSVLNARGYVFEQMQVHAQDTATSLGLTISHAAQEKDQALIQSFVDVVFDRGYYRNIYYRSFSGDVTIQRNLPIDIEGVPDWFVRLVDLPEPAGRSEVGSGWMRLGELVVVSHPGYAYRDLWRVFNEQLWLFMFVAVLGYGLVGMGLRYLLRPLRQVESQAEAICRREFPVQERLPSTPELRRMVLAMNRMVNKIQGMFQEQVELTESLHRKAYLDAVTGLSNRRDFDSRFEAFIKSEDGGSSGMLLLVHVNGLQQFNERFGREAGDQCIKDAAQVLVAQMGGLDKAILSRRSGTDLCAFVPVADDQEGRKLAQDLFSQLVALSWLNDDTALGVHLGVAFNARVMLDNELLKQADLALRQAEQQGARQWHWYQPSGDENVRSAQEWRQLLVRAIENELFHFHLQPVFAPEIDAVARKQIQLYEVLCRFTDGEQVLNAGVFLPMAERFGLSAAIDKLMLQQLLGYYRNRFSSMASATNKPKLCVNLSPSSVLDGEFLLWLSAFLEANEDFAQGLMLELPEQTLAMHEESVRGFVELVTGKGVEISLDHFGASASAFHYLQSLSLSALKIDRQFVQALDTNTDNQFFVKSLLHIAHSCDLLLRAEGIETEEEWQALLDLGIDGGQGYFLGMPAPVEV